MASGRFIAYYRVSTDRQGRSGLGLDAQRKAVTDYLDGGNWELLNEFTEIESGKRNDRPQLAEAIKVARKEKATLIIAKLDRLARNVHFISGLLEGGVDFCCCDMPEADRAFLQIAAVFAEWEGRKISERTKAALAAAKARGVKLGCPDPAKGSAIGAHATRARANQFAENTLPVIASIRAAGVTTLQGIADALNARGIATARGGEWHPATVRNIANRPCNGTV